MFDFLIMFLIFVAIASSILGTAVYEATRLFFRCLRLRQLAVPLATTAAEMPTSAQDQRTVFNELMSTLAYTDQLRQNLMNEVMNKPSAHYPELILMSNTLRTAKRLMNSLDGLLTNLEPTSSSVVRLSDVLNGSTGTACSAEEPQPSTSAPQASTNA
jgi:hypothetical protein